MRSWPDRAFLLAALFALAAAGCGAPVTGDEPSGDPGVETQDACSDNGLTYVSVGEPFLRDHCTGCHSAGVTGQERRGAPDGMDFDTEETARAHLDRIGVRVASEETPMPPGGGPSDEDRDL